MTVAELIKELQKKPDEYQVRVSTAGHDFERVEEIDTQIGYVVIYSEPLP